MRGYGRCPVCDTKCNDDNDLTYHHVYYPRRDYELNTIVNICRCCHNEFNRKYKFTESPSEWECLMNLLRFCKSKGKNALTIYPEIFNLWPA
jgi:hypothetical protein